MGCWCAVAVTLERARETKRRNSFILTVRGQTRTANGRSVAARVYERAVHTPGSVRLKETEQRGAQGDKAKLGAGLQNRRPGSGAGSSLLSDFSPSSQWQESTIVCGAGLVCETARVVHAVVDTGTPTRDLNYMYSIPSTTSPSQRRPPLPPLRQLHSPLGSQRRCRGLRRSTWRRWRLQTAYRTVRAVQPCRATRVSTLDSQWATETLGVRAAIDVISTASKNEGTERVLTTTSATTIFNSPSSVSSSLSHISPNALSPPPTHSLTALFPPSPLTMPARPLAAPHRPPSPRASPASPRRRVLVTRGRRDG